MSVEKYYNDAVQKVAWELGLPKVFVDRVYKSYWRAVRAHITSLPLKQDLTDEEFLSLKTSVNVPSLGKFHIPLERYKYLKRMYNEYLESKEE